jgi:8-oxo-dGTP diphosphatase
MKTSRSSVSNARRSISKEEKAYLAAYKPGDYARPSVTVDIVIFTIIDTELSVLMIRRADHPFKGAWALPGGFVDVGDAERKQGEDLEAAALRELQEETNLRPKDVYLEQLGAFGTPGRDPRMRVITIAYYALVRPDLIAKVEAGSDAAAAEWLSVAALTHERLAFDHAHIIDAALARTRERISSSDVAQSLVPKTFTIPELRSVFEIISGKSQDPGNFRRRFARLQEDGVIVKADGKRITRTKPAAVYRFA